MYQLLNIRCTSLYPGFQWNGGAYVKSAYVSSSTGLLDRNKVDSIDFGNSLITDFEYSGSSNGKSITATDITVFADDNTYNINALDFSEINGEDNPYGINNRPVGMSLNSSITSTTYDVLSRTLGSDGYPKLKNGTSLAYLFKDDGTDDTYAHKQNSTSIDGLFQQDSTGKYYYNSRENHAQYSNGKFTLYNQIITPNFIVYPFGNFLPFNDITSSDTSTQVGKITSMKNYVQYLLNKLYPYYNGYSNVDDSSREQLYYMLNEYKKNVQHYGIHNMTWDNFNAADAIWDYFKGDQNGDNPTDDTNFITTEHLNNMYNIDFDVEKNFFFGMEMKMNFYQPKDGLTGTDGKQPMVFYFTGDDDVWVYIDDVLFLDLSGIHRHVGGEIDFKNGKVHYYALDIENGDVSSTPYQTYTFEEILSAAGRSTDGLNDTGTFENYTTHSFKFYYTERGSGSSVCRLNFNFPLVKQNTITIEKELVTDKENVGALGNPDFTFQVLDKTTNVNFLGSDWAYSLYDKDDKGNDVVIQEIKVSEKYPDGRVSKMTITDSERNVLCTEEYDAYGNLTKREGTAENLAKVLRIDGNGCFKLKAGQKAEFVGIPESQTQYYVRELLPDELDEQYDVTVSGTTATQTQDKITIGQTNFVGQDSTVQDAHVSSSFEFKNTVATSKLGSLSITKNVDATYSSTTSDNVAFEFNVTLDGEPIPKDTPYYDGTEENGAAPNGKVTKEGSITIKADQTVTIPYILIGTRFEVTETTASSKGYTVTYTVDGGSQGASSAKGVVDESKTTAVLVRNSEKGDKVTFKVWKSLYAYDEIPRTYTFKLEEVTVDEVKEGAEIANITTVTGGTSATSSVEIKDALNYSTFELSYSESDYETLPKTIYYRITEEYDEDGDTQQNNGIYVAKVVLSRNADNVFEANVEKIWNQLKSADSYSIISSTSEMSYVNTVIDSLTIGKTVSGSESAKEAEYTFNITLTKGDSKSAGGGVGAELSNSYSAVRTYPDETEDSLETVAFNNVDLSDNTVKYATVTLKHGETLTLNNIPIGTMWTVKETNSDSFTVTYDGTVSGKGSEASGTIVKDGSTVTFTNTQIYALPETGGTGTTSYTMAGLMLILFSVAYLMYTRANKRKEVS